MKEPGYVSLGWRGEISQLVLIMARSKILKEALNIGRDEIQTAHPLPKKRQLQGKTKTKALMRELIKSTNNINQLHEQRHKAGSSTSTVKKRSDKHSPVN